LHARVERAATVVPPTVRLDRARPSKRRGSGDAGTSIDGRGVHHPPGFCRPRAPGDPSWWSRAPLRIGRAAPGRRSRGEVATVTPCPPLRRSGLRSSTCAIGSLCRRPQGGPITTSRSQAGSTHRSPAEAGFRDSASCGTPTFAASGGVPWLSSPRRRRRDRSDSPRCTRRSFARLSPRRAFPSPSPQRCVILPAAWRCGRPSGTRGLSVRICVGRNRRAAAPGSARAAAPTRGPRKSTLRHVPTSVQVDPLPQAVVSPNHVTPKRVFSGRAGPPGSRSTRERGSHPSREQACPLSM
jgi:hypothetical protein